MSDKRGLHLVLIFCFAAIIGAAGIAQVVIELRQGRDVQVLELFRREPSAENLRRFENRLEEQSWFAKQLRPPVQYARYRLVDDPGDKAVIGREGWWFYRPGVRFLVEPIEENADKKTGFEHAVLAIVDFRDQLARRGIRLLVVPVPGKASVYPDRLTGRLETPSSLYGHTHRLLEALAINDVETVDLQVSFSNAREAGQDALYLVRDTHWTPEGAELAATIVADRLVELDWIERGETHFETREVVVERPGDVLEMMQASTVEKRFEPQRVTCRQVIDPATGEPSKDDSASPVLVLGDSFLRIYERDEPGSAGFVSHLARSLRRPVASIVNDGGASTLVRQQLARQVHLLEGKRVVVWEYVERDVRFGLQGWQKVDLVE